MGTIHEIDEKNMYAVIEPLVSLAQLHAEANKRGLYIGSPEASAQSSAVAGHLFQGMWGVGYRLGVAYRNILGIEWVLPNGEILRTGSFSQDSDNGFWGEGPGPDLRGMLRGYAGAMGGVGRATSCHVRYSGVSYDGGCPVRTLWGRQIPTLSAGDCAQIGFADTARAVLTSGRGLR